MSACLFSCLKQWSYGEANSVYAYRFLLMMNCTVAVGCALWGNTSSSPWTNAWHHVCTTNRNTPSAHPNTGGCAITSSVTSIAFSSSATFGQAPRDYIDCVRSMTCFHGQDTHQRWELDRIWLLAMHRLTSPSRLHQIQRPWIYLHQVSGSIFFGFMDWLSIAYNTTRYTSGSVDSSYMVITRFILHNITDALPKFIFNA
jgi:hypothetical protein